MCQNYFFSHQSRNTKISWPSPIQASLKGIEMQWAHLLSAIVWSSCCYLRQRFLISSIVFSFERVSPEEMEFQKIWWFWNLPIWQRYRWSVIQKIGSEMAKRSSERFPSFFCWPFQSGNASCLYLPSFLTTLMGQIPLPNPWQGGLLLPLAKT